MALNEFAQRFERYGFRISRSPNGKAYVVNKKPCQLCNELGTIRKVKCTRISYHAFTPANDDTIEPLMEIETVPCQYCDGRGYTCYNTEEMKGITWMIFVDTRNVGYPEKSIHHGDSWYSYSRYENLVKSVIAPVGGY